MPRVHLPWDVLGVQQRRTSSGSTSSTFIDPDPRATSFRWGSRRCRQGPGQGAAMTKGKGTKGYVRVARVVHNPLLAWSRHNPIGAGGCCTPINRKM
eukprot:2194980-Pyramimonas_sp.AAC.1